MYWLKTLSKNILAVGKTCCLRCFCCAGSVSEMFFSVLRIENLGSLGCVEQICESIRMRYESTKTHGWRKLKLDWQSGRNMQTILSSLLWFIKIMKDGKSGTERHYYFLLPNKRSIQVGAHYSTTCEKKIWQKVKVTGRPRNKHDIQIEKWKVTEKLFTYENLRRRTIFYCTLLYLNSEGISENFEELLISIFRIFM